MEKVTVEHFWQTVLLYLTRPNLINRRYIGAQCARYWKGSSTTDNKIESRELWSRFGIGDLVKNLALQQISGPLTASEVLKTQTPIVVLRKLFRKQSLKLLQTKCNTEPDAEYDCVILYPTRQKFCVLILDNILDSNDVNNAINNAVNDTVDEKLFTLHCEQYSYGMTFNLSEKNLKIDYLFGTETIESKTTFWLDSVLKPKLQRWIVMSAETKEKERKAAKKVKDKEKNRDNEKNEKEYKDSEVSSLFPKIIQQQESNQLQGSITRISIETYCCHYNRLKSKYSIELLEIWKTLEKTDPLKFIFEDIAIAAYLLTLWSEERQKFGIETVQTFVDVGCGNGLLVYILTQEGHKGCGIDVRRRNIWDHYGVELDLREEQLDPKDEKSVERIPKVDWMIGNHSDELTPWILMLSSKISFRMRIFLLPCCPFDFDGRKFQRTAEESKSQYQGYMEYLMDLAERFGFRCWRDKLKIPSTKRTCIVGYDRRLPNGKSFNNITDEEAHVLLKDFNEQRENIVEERLKARTLTMKLRQQEIVVRNCTRIDGELRQRMVKKIVKLLLQHQKVTFKQILSQFREPEIVAAMKNQCGGIQTFVRNHKYIFAIKDSKVQFQTPEGLKIPMGQEEREKARLCWFKLNHPDGCPLSDMDCRYKH